MKALISILCHCREVLKFGIWVSGLFRSVVELFKKNSNLKILFPSSIKVSLQPFNGILCHFHNVSEDLIMFQIFFAMS